MSLVRLSVESSLFVGQCLLEELGVLELMLPSLSVVQSLAAKGVAIKRRL